VFCFHCRETAGLGLLWTDPRKFTCAASGLKLYISTRISRVFLWWATIGLSCIALSLRLGFVGLASFYAGVRYLLA
jgi:hypothetical protein